MKFYASNVSFMPLGLVFLGYAQNIDSMLPVDFV